MFDRLLWKFQSPEKLRKKKQKINHWHGKSTDKGFDKLCKKLDRMEDEINRKEWKRYKREQRKNKRKKVKEPPPRHREHGWYLPNDE